MPGVIGTLVHWGLLDPFDWGLPTTVHIGFSSHTHAPLTALLGLLTAFAPTGHFLLVSEGIG